MIHKASTVITVGEFGPILKQERDFSFSKQQEIIFIFFILLTTIIVVIITRIKLNSTYDIFYNIIYFYEMCV